MRRLVILTIIQTCGKALVLTIFAVIVIGVIGDKNQYTALQYSNAYFIAGALLIIAGASSRLGASQEWGTFQLLHAESFRHMSNTDRANFIIEVSSSYSLLILGLLSGITLFIISALVAKSG